MNSLGRDMKKLEEDEVVAREMVRFARNRKLGSTCSSFFINAATILYFLALSILFLKYNQTKQNKILIL